MTGKSLSELFSERIFARLGAEHDAYFTVDPTGAEFAGGGLNLTLRDLARFGEMIGSAAATTASRSCPTPSSTTSGAAATAALRAGGLQDAAGLELSQHVVGVARRHGTFTAVGFTVRRSTSIRRPRWSSRVRVAPLAGNVISIRRRCRRITPSPRYSWGNASAATLRGESQRCSGLGWPAVKRLGLPSL